MTDIKVHNLYDDDVPRYVVQALKTVAPDWLSMANLVENYDPPKPNNMAEIQADTKRAEGHRPTVAEMKRRLIDEAVDNINLDTDQPVIEYDDNQEAYRLAEGTDINTLKLDGKLLVPKPVFGDPFNPDTGIFGHNVRTPKADGYKELRESMREFGYLPGHPIIRDENGVIIAGHRRATVAGELGIDPDVLELNFGSGDAADAERLKLAIGSNIGFEPVSQADRQKIALHLYDGKQWTMAKIAEALNVSTMQVSRDLDGLTQVKPKRGGRGHKKAGPEPAPEPIDNVIELPQHPTPAPEVESSPAAEVEPDLIITGDDGALVSSWEFSYRSDGTAGLSLTFFDDDERYIQLDSGELPTFITPAVAAELVSESNGALNSIYDLQSRLDKRAGELDES